MQTKGQIKRTITHDSCKPLANVGGGRSNCHNAGDPGYSEHRFGVQQQGYAYSTSHNYHGGRSICAERLWAPPVTKVSSARTLSTVGQNVSAMQGAGSHNTRARSMFVSFENVTYYSPTKQICVYGLLRVILFTWSKIIL